MFQRFGPFELPHYLYVYNLQPHILSSLAIGWVPGGFQAEDHIHQRTLFIHLYLGPGAEKGAVK